MAATPACTQPDIPVRPVVRRRDLQLYPDIVQPPSPMPPTLTPARVTFQPPWDDRDDKQCSRTRYAGVTDLASAENSPSWEEEDGEDEERKDRSRGASYDDDDVAKNNSNSSADTVATMLDRLYGNDNQSDNNATTTRFRAAREDQRWCDRYADSTRNEYSDMVAEWKRHALQLKPHSPHSSLLTDGDQLIRVDGEDGSGKLLFDLASCR